VLAASGVPPFRETQDYVAHVALLRALCKGHGAPPMRSASR
jgi:hypothetical protein